MNLRERATLYNIHVLHIDQIEARWDIKVQAIETLALQSV